MPATWSHKAGISQTETPLLLVPCLPPLLSVFELYLKPVVFEKGSQTVVQACLQHLM